MGWLCFLHS